jgi:hypothetical protein
MKKIKLISILILLSSQLFSQNLLDTICHSLAGKIHFEFDYFESKIINKTTNEFLEDTEINIDTNEFLVLDLYDNCKCVKTQNFIKERKIIVYFRDGEIKTYKNNSEDTVLHFDGSEIKKVIINKPKLREENPHDIRRS